MTQLFVDLKSLTFEYDSIFMKKIRNDLLNSLKTRFDNVEKDKYYTYDSLIDPSYYFLNEF